MPAKYIITDEIDDSRTVDVSKGGSLKVSQNYAYSLLSSATASGVLVNAGCLLHSVVIPSSAAASVFMLGDTLSACASAINTETAPSSAMAYINCSVPGTYIFDTICSQTLCYRLTGDSTTGVVVTYQLT